MRCTYAVCCGCGGDGGMRVYETVAGSMFTFTQLCKSAKRRNYVYVEPQPQPALEMLYKFLLIVTINIVESSQW